MNQPQTFRKKPVEIQAVQWDGNLQTAMNFITEEFSVEDDTRNLYIATLEGEMECRIGDWIIRGVENEYYPCKDSIFKATYEPVEETDD